MESRVYWAGISEKIHVDILKGSSKLNLHNYENAFYIIISLRVSRFRLIENEFSQDDLIEDYI